MKFLFFVVLFVAPLFTSCQQTLDRSPSNIFYQDDRQTHALEDFPQWGRVAKTTDSDRHPWGTGFLIHSCYVATAYHVVQSTDIPLTGNERVYFHHFKAVLEASPVLWGDPLNASLNENDWVVLKLSECLDIEPLKMEALSKKELRERKLFNAGFPEDRHPKNISVDMHCQSGPEVQEVGFGHDCATRPGSSGSPLLSSLDGKDVVIGLTVASRGYFDDYIGGYSEWISNKACPIGPLKRSFEKLLKENP